MSILVQKERFVDDGHEEVESGEVRVDLEEYKNLFNVMDLIRKQVQQTNLSERSRSGNSTSSGPGSAWTLPKNTAAGK